jgi:lipopolysaccharide exporter
MSDGVPPSEDVMMPDDSLSRSELRTRALRGLRWTVVARPAGEVVLLASTVVLARLISPAEFGRFAVAAIAGSIAVIPRAGVSAAIVQRPSLTREHLQAAGAIALLIGLGLVALTLLAAGSIVAPLYGGHTADLVRLCAPLCFVVALGTVSSGQLQRRLAIRRTSLIEVSSTLVRVGATIGMAVAGMNATALVLGWLAGEALELALLCISAPPPLPWLHRKQAWELLSFGLPASLAASSWFGFRNCDYAIVGARLGVLPAGMYFRAYTLAVEYQKKVSQVMNTVGFPMLARTQSAEQMSELRLRMVRMLTIVLFPMLALLAILAPVLVPWLFGHRWEPAVVPTQILAIGGASTLAIDAAGAALMASGRARAVMGFGWGHFLVYALAVFVVAPMGIVAVAVAAAVVHTAFLVVAYVLLLSRSPENPFARLWRDICPATLSSLVLVAVATPLSMALRSEHVAAIPYLASVTLLGAFSYLLALRLLFPTSLASLRSFLGHLIPVGPLRRVAGRAAPAVNR